MRPGLVRALVAVALLSALALFWVQAARSRDRLTAELPRLRASIAALELQAQEVARLKSIAPAAMPAARTPLATLATDGGGVPGARITVIDERRVRFAGDDVAFGALLEWLGRAQSAQGMRVESARIDALPAAGRVKAELVLARS